MVNYNILRSFTFSILLSAAVLMTVGCTGTSDGELGYDMIPSHQMMKMRHLTFKGGKVIKFDPSASSDDKSVYTERAGKFFETSLYKSDSMLSNNISYGYLGIERSDTFGMRSAALATSMVFMNTLPEYGFGYKPIFDTLSLLLSIENYSGDTLVPIKYRVYELKKPLLGNVISESDTTAYTNGDMSGMYDPTKPIFTFTFPDGEKTGPVFSNVPMTPVDLSEGGQTWDFVRRLMLIPDNYNTSEWDGYARDPDSVYAWEDTFIDRFPGLYFEPVIDESVEGKRGSLCAFELASSGVYLQARNRLESDPRFIQDTVCVTYNFYDSSLDIDDGETSKKNMSVVLVKHDYEKSLTNSQPSELNSLEMRAYDDAGNKIPHSMRDVVSECYVEGMAGVNTELYFTDEFLEELLSLTNDNGEKYDVVAFNQVRLMTYLRGSQYDWANLDSTSEALIESLDWSLVRLGAYVNPSTLSSIADYNYIYEQSSSDEINYDGNLNRSRAYYSMNITSYMQNLYNYLRELHNSYGDKWLANYDETKTPRHIILGPEATLPFTFRRTILQGADSTVAPIHVEMSYTLIK